MEVSCYIQKTCPWWNKSSAKKTALNLAREYYEDKNLKKKGREAYKTCWFWRHCKAPQCEYHLWTKEGGCRIYVAVSLWQHSVQKRPAYNKQGLFGRALFFYQRDGCTLQAMGCKGCRQIFTRNENLIRHLKDERCTGGKTKIICSGGKFKHTLNSSEKVFYGGDTKFSQWIEAQAIETGKHIHHKMCGHGRERMVKV